MSNPVDRRTQVRFKIPESEIYYKLNGSFSFLNRYVGPMDLIDISKSGAGFFGMPPLNKNDVVRLQIKLPEFEGLKLKGIVRWTRDDPETGALRIGIQFSPFGTGREYNSLQMLETLGKLSEQFN